MTQAVGVQNRSAKRGDRGRVCNSNWTEWSTIQGVNGRVFSKQDEREARGRFEK